MARAVLQFVCRSCGSAFAKWSGRCPDCGTWDSLEQARLDASSKVDRPMGSSVLDESQRTVARPITDIDDSDTPSQRIATGIAEFDRVLGGQATSNTKANAGNASHPARMGLVPGSAVLVGGDPGIGKSTLLLQAAHRVAHAGHTVLYVSSEESAAQVKLRAERLAPPDQALPASLYVLADTNLARVLEQCRKLKPAVVVVDSIQMVYKGDLPAAPGTVSQLRACTLELVYHAKQTDTALLLVGHVTKEGALAGPKLLEHMVDAVLYFEGDRYHQHRIVRAIKNRFGNTLEVGLFEMTGIGLMEVTNPGGIVGGDAGGVYQPRPGSVVCPVLSGSRCLLVEVQALTATGFLGAAKRKVSGLDSNRLAMLIAVLEKRGELRLADQDIFANSVGGLKVAEPAVDLAVALAIAGAHLNKPLPAGVCVAGEVGLGGEVRHVQQAERRVAEAARLGFTRLLLPRGSSGNARKKRGSSQSDTSADVTEVSTLAEAMQWLGG